MKIKISTAIFLFIIGIVIGAVAVSGSNLGILDFEEVEEKPIQQGEMEIYFCPEDNCDVKLLSQIAAAEETIHAAVYSFTLDSIGDALIAAKGRGVEVMVVVDEQQAAQQYSEYQKLKDAGIDIRLDGNSGYMHNKFAVFDSRIVATGSYNWTQNASERNDENLVIMFSEDAAQEYTGEFWEIFNAGN